MAFRDELGAAQARADALERKVAELEQENDRLRSDEAEPPAPRRRPRKALVLAGVAVLSATIAGVSILIGDEIAVVGAAMAAMILLTGVITVSLVQLVGPGELLVISGQPRALPEGGTRGYRLVTQGSAIPLPLLETVDRMSTGAVSASVRVDAAYVKDGIPANFVGEAVIRYHGTEPLVHNAVERFLGRDMREMTRVAQETIEGNLRAVAATLTFQEMRGDREALSHKLIEEAESDLDKLGIDLVDLEILAVTTDAS